MAEERMPSIQYAKYEKIFYLYGSCAKMVTGVRPDEWKALAEEMWAWAIVKVSALVDEFTEGTSESPAEAPAPPPPEPEKSTDKPTEVPVVTQAQAKRFYALAHSSGKSDDQIKAYLATYGIASGWKIPRTEYDRLCALVQQ